GNQRMQSAVQLPVADAQAVRMAADVFPPFPLQGNQPGVQALQGAGREGYLHRLLFAEQPGKPLFPACDGPGTHRRTGCGGRVVEKQAVRRILAVHHPHDAVQLLFLLCQQPAERVYLFRTDKTAA
ncbi:hypothetical protein, partial [Bacteroides fragilis]|uniref:hypothetical protein n=1 Tax=Bacteroides fragilis TaxID=817 RepID=UPI0018AF9209